MYPVLLEIGFFKIFTYGLLVASAFLAAILYSVRQAGREGMEQEKVMDLCFYILLFSIVGARVLYVIVEYRFFLDHPLDVFKFWKGGLVFYGGLIGGALSAYVYMRMHRMPVWKVADLLAPSIALGQAIGRWGCFFAGCCYGLRTDVPWAITFTDPRSLAPLDVPLHPTQIYSSFKAIVIFSILVWFRRCKRFDGQIFWLYGCLYSIGRFIVEFYRGDDRGFAVPGMLSTSQFIGIFTLIFSLGMLYALRRMQNRGEEAG